MVNTRRNRVIEAMARKATPTRTQEVAWKDKEVQGLTSVKVGWIGLRES